MATMKRYRKIIIVTFVVMASIELFARALHIADIPIYRSDREFGYIPVENQSGNFLLTKDWFFNNKSMGTDRKFESGRRGGVLLIGDSIVLGGNVYSQAQRLGPRLESDLKTDVWPVSAGSWALQNELAYIRMNIDVVRQFNQVVLILNSDDFGDPSYWNSELTHPTFIYLSHAIFFLNKYLFKIDIKHRSQVVELYKRDNMKDFQYISDILGRPIYIFLYPTKKEISNKSPCIFVPKWMSDKYANNMSCISDSHDWNTDLYADNIHPTAQGTRILARILADQLRIYSTRDAKR